MIHGRSVRDPQNHLNTCPNLWVYQSFLLKTTTFWLKTTKTRIACYCASSTEWSDRSQQNTKKSFFFKLVSFFVRGASMRIEQKPTLLTRELIWRLKNSILQHFSQYCNHLFFDTELLICPFSTKLIEVRFWTSSKC